MPERIQLRRTKGWRKPEGAVVVARPSKWGNPMRVFNDDQWAAAEWFGVALDLRRAGRTYPSFVTYPSDDEIRASLAGRDLACWCRLDQPCHADVLLELANGATA